MTSIVQSGAAAIIEPAPGDTPAPATDITAEPPDRRRRRRMIVLITLLLTALVLILLVIWYLLFRQPITDLLPIFEPTNPPAYQRSIYELERPLDVAVTADGSRIIITQGGGDRSTVMLDESGAKLATLAPPPTVTLRPTQLYVAVNPVNGEIAATDRTNGAVFRYSSDGTYLGVFEPNPSLDGWQPLGIAFDARGNMFVTDAGGPSQRVHMFAPDGSLVRDFGVEVGLDHPNGIAVDATGYVYVADSNNGRLIAFDPSGAVHSVVRRGPAVGDLGMPRGVAIDGKGRIYVVDSVGQNVQMYRTLQAGDAGPVHLTAFGQGGTNDGAFQFPNGVAVDGRGRVYVADWNNDRVQVWSY